MTHTLHTHIKTENFDQDDYRVYLTRDLEWTTRNHPMQKTPITPEGAWGESNAQFDQDLMQRLCDFIKPINFSLDPGSMWGDTAQKHKKFLIHLRNNNLEIAHDYLNRAHQTPLMHGIGQGEIEFDYITRYPDTVGVMKLKRHWDVLIGIMEYCGVIGPQNHEQGASYVAVPINDLLAALPQTVQAPRWQGGLWALNTNRGLFCERDLTALYLAYKIKEKIPEITSSSILEIGGGAGYLAYWLYRFGYKNITMVDLPSVICVQAYQLAQNIGKENICLPNEEYHGQAVRFQTAEQLHNGDYRFDLVVNCDSMPEMDKKSLNEYLATIARSADLFFSVNQESRGTYNNQMQHVVRSVIKKEFGEKFARTDRSIHWLRNGYTEEWYSIVK